MLSEEKKKRRTKEDYENVINTLLDTSIKWSKLSLEELIEFAVILNHPETFMEKLGVKTPAEQVSEAVTKTTMPLVKEAVKLWSESSGPLATLLRKVQAKAQEKLLKP